MKSLSRLLIGLLLAASAHATTFSVQVEVTPAGVASKWPTNADWESAAGNFRWGTVPPISIEVGADWGRNDRALLLTDPGAATIGITGCTLASGFTLGADGIVGTDATAYSQLCRYTALSSLGAFTAVSEPFRVEAIAPPVADDQAPPYPIALTATANDAGLALTFDASCDNYEPDGTAPSGTVSYDVRLNGGTPLNIAAPSCTPKLLAATNIGSHGSSPSSAQTANDYQIVSGGDMDGADDILRFLSASAAADFSLSILIDSVSNNGASFAKYGLQIRNLTANNAVMALCGYQGNDQTQVRRRNTAGASVGGVASAAASLPRWYQLVKSGNTIDCLSSTDGNSFTAHADNYSITWSSPVEAGLFTTGAASTLSTGNYENFNFNTAGSVSYQYNTTLTGSISVDVRALDNDGNASMYGPAVVVARSAPADTTPPTFSVQPSGVAGGQTSINWDAGTCTDPGANASGVRGYIPQTKTSSGGTRTAQPEQVSSSYTQSGLTANTTYYLDSQCVDNAGNVSVGYSTQASATTESGAPPAFTAPTTTLTVIGSSTIRATITAVEGADHFITGYRASSSANWTVLTAYDVVGLTYDYGGFSPGQTGCYRHAAANADESTIGPWSTGGCATTESTGTGGLKWHPGHYMLLDGGTWSSTVQATHFSQIDAICANSNIKGVQITFKWSNFETALNNYSQGFTFVQAYLTRVAACNKRLMVVVREREFGTPNGNWPSTLPTYLNSGTYNGGAWLGTVGQSYAGNLRALARIWDPVVMNRLIALSQAYGAQFDDDPNFEMFAIEGETSVSAGPSEDGFSYAGWYTQLKRWVEASRAAWPHTQLRLYTNWTGTDAQLNDLMAHGAPRQVAICCGPDVLPDRGITADRVVRGLNGNGTVHAGWLDYRGQVGIVTEVQYPEWAGSYGDWTPEELYDYAHDTLRTTHMVWYRNEAVGTSEKRWSTGILPFINSISGAVYTTSCPTLYTACDTN